jgi:hypothetical protein
MSRWRDVLPPLLGHHIGARCGDEVAAIIGLPADTDEDALKAVGAAAIETARRDRRSRHLHPLRADHRARRLCAHSAQLPKATPTPRPDGA